MLNMEQKRKAIGVAMALAGAELFHLTGSSSSSSEEEGEEATARTDNFMEVVQSMSDDKFCQHFRLTRETFLHLVTLIGKCSL